MLKQFLKFKIQTSEVKVDSEKVSNALTPEKKRHKKLTQEEYIQALEKMKNSPNDRIGLLGEMGVTGVGALAGIGLGTAAAGAVGASTILGSSTLGSLLGGVFVATTPIGWIIGGAAVTGGLAYGLTKFIRSGMLADSEKERNIQVLEGKVKDLEQSEKDSDDVNQQMIELFSLLQDAVSLGFEQTKSNKLIEQVLKQKITVVKARNLVQGYIYSKMEKD